VAVAWGRCVGWRVGQQDCTPDSGPLAAKLLKLDTETVVWHALRDLWRESARARLSVAVRLGDGACRAREREGPNRFGQCGGASAPDHLSPS